MHYKNININTSRRIIDIHWHHDNIHKNYSSSYIYIYIFRWHKQQHNSWSSCRRQGITHDSWHWRMYRTADWWNCSNNTAQPRVKQNTYIVSIRKKSSKQTSLSPSMLKSSTWPPCYKYQSENISTNSNTWQRNVGKCLGVASCDSNFKMAEWRRVEKRWPMGDQSKAATWIFGMK